MTSVAYEIVDVFTDRPFTGNPLAVVFGAEELASSQ
ncbi:MAG TPA: PhzF family phenazine biosynthesis protein, partial [Asanoa sp.]|nr:PhzF family phenazine biosynthesis protein [Asanoa sp.]